MAQVQHRGGFQVYKPTSGDPVQPVGPFLIQGQAAGSSIEYNVSVALARLKLRYSYQYPVLGGRQARGGTVIDFLVYLAPQPIPLYVQGDYWHGSPTKKELDKWTFSRIRAWMHYTVADPVLVWEHEALTPDMALAACKRVLHL